MIVLLLAALLQESAAPTATRVRLGEGNISLELPAETRRRMAGLFLHVKIAEAGGRYARIKPELDDRKIAAADAQLHLRKLAAEQKLKAYKYGELIFTHAANKSGEPTEPGTIHTFAGCNGAGVLTCSIVAPPDMAEDAQKKLAEQTIPALLATARWEDPWSPDRAADGQSAGGMDERAPAMRQAIGESRQTAAEFAELLATPGARKEFAVKAKFIEGDAVEWLWISNPKATAEGFEGEIAGTPTAVKKIKAGDRAKVARDAIGDWMCLGPDGLEGGYSVRVLLPTLPAAERDAMKKEFKLVD
jgi:uncharacterized protein YegJ (DUF2314 family)